MEDIFEMQSSSDTEEIMVPCEHCNAYVNLAIEEHCPNCNLSIFLSPEEVFHTLLKPYDIKMAEAITKEGQKYLRELLDLQFINEPKVNQPWTDKPKPQTSLEIEISRVSNKNKWGLIFERYIKEVPDWETNTLMPLTEWLTQNYKAPDEK